MTESEALIHFLRLLNGTTIDYCIAGNTEGLPTLIHSDIDFVIHDRNLSAFDELIDDFANQVSGKRIQKIAHEFNATYSIICWWDVDILRTLRIDVCGNYVRGSRLLLTADFILHNRTQQSWSLSQTDYFNTPAIGAAFLYYLVKRLDKLDIGATQICVLATYWRTDRQQCRNALGTIWSETDCEQITLSLDNGIFSVNLADLRYKLHKHRPIMSIHMILDIFRRIRRMVNPTGLYIVFLGPDGSGKSSVIELVKSDLSIAFRNYRYFHLRPRLLSRTKIQGSPVDKPHLYPPYAPVKSLAKIIFLVSDYIIGYLVLIAPRLIKSFLIISDRHYQDIRVDPLRYRYGGPKFIVPLFGLLVPRPSMYVVLYADAAVIQTRKSEVDFQETTRQIDKYIELSRCLPNSILINTSAPIESVKKQVLECVISTMHSKLNKK